MKFFASYREVLGKDELEKELKENTNISTLLELLRKEHHELGSLSETLIVAVNREYAAHDTILKDGDEVALLPPVSGG